MLSGGRPQGLGAKANGGSTLVVDALSGNFDYKKGAMLLADNKATIAVLSARQMGAGKTAAAIDAAKNLVSLATTLWDQALPVCGTC